MSPMLWKKQLEDKVAALAATKGGQYAMALKSDFANLRIMLHAGNMAYISLGSVVPSLAATFAIMSVFQPIANPSADWFTDFRLFILQNLAPEAGEQMVSFMERFLANLDVTAIGVSGFVALLAILALLLKNIEIAFNEIWQVANTRSLFKRFLFFWTAVTLGALCLSISVALLGQFNLMDTVGLGTEKGPDAGMAGSWVMTTLATFVFFTMLHKIAPNCHVSVKAAVAGGVTATILIRLAAHGFGEYMRYSEWNQNVYEALAVVPFFLLWLYVGWFVMLVSAIVAWRAQYGFAVIREAEGMQATENLDCLELERNLQLRAGLPLLCVTAVGYHFSKATGIGITGAEIARQLDLPLNWVREALIVAEKQGVLAIGREQEISDEHDPDVAHLPVYPAAPMDSVKVQDLVKLFTGDARHWLKDRKTTMPIDIGRLANMLGHSVCLEDDPATMQSIIDSVRYDHPKASRASYSGENG